MSNQSVDNMRLNDLAYWFPILESIGGINLPKTVVLRTDLPLIQLCDGILPENVQSFIDALHDAAMTVGGYPVFLRTGQTSAKHDWSRSCYVTEDSDWLEHVCAIVEYSSIVSMIGLPCSTWAVREFLPLEHTFTAFSGMTVAREYRCFFRDGRWLCAHPYWPESSIYNPSKPDWKVALAWQNEMGSMMVYGLRKIVEQVAPAFSGAWSLDVAHHVDGRWFVTDMALAAESFHWYGCPNYPENQRPPEPDPEDEPFLQLIRQSEKPS